MAQSNSDSWIGFLAAPIGGAVIAIIVWVVAKKPCPIGTLAAECVELGDKQVYSPAGLMGAGALIGLFVAGVIYVFREIGS